MLKKLLPTPISYTLFMVLCIISCEMSKEEKEMAKISSSSYYLFGNLNHYKQHKINNLFYELNLSFENKKDTNKQVKLNTLKDFVNNKDKNVN